MATATHIEQVRRPEGAPQRGDFRLVEAELAPLEPGEALIENRFLSVDPYLRGRMSDRRSYYPPWPLAAPLDAAAIGVVVESRAPATPEGTWVASEHGLRDRFTAAAEDLRRLAPPPAGHDHAVYLEALGSTGFTAWIGVAEILDPVPGDVIWVTTAAGSVGSIAGQLCREAGATVIGSTGSRAKVEHVRRQLGFDAAFDYHTIAPSEAMRQLAPTGIDGLFDNVGGDQLEAALDAMRVGGRIAKCGDIASYNSAALPPGPRNLHHFYGKRLTMRGFLVSDHFHRRAEFEAAMRGWLDAGVVRTDRHVVHGLDQVVPAFLGLFSGDNIGKTVVALGDEAGRDDEDGAGDAAAGDDGATADAARAPERPGT